MDKLHLYIIYFLFANAKLLWQDLELLDEIGTDTSQIINV